MTLKTIFYRTMLTKIKKQTENILLIVFGDDINDQRKNKNSYTN